MLSFDSILKGQFTQITEKKKIICLGFETFVLNLEV